MKQVLESSEYPHPDNEDRRLVEVTHIEKLFSRVAMGRSAGNTDVGFGTVHRLLDIRRRERRDQARYFEMPIGWHHEVFSLGYCG